VIEYSNITTIKIIIAILLSAENFNIILSIFKLSLFQQKIING